ncbi:MAG TPA: hypothetical protein VD997_05090 [Phycisphaerales bacterium]|nr:hypothetical protein [Phycisphaerales bacterium]
MVCKCVIGVAARASAVVGVVVGVGLVGMGTASADIVNAGGQFDRTISVRDPVGQSFTAVDADIGAISLAFSDINPSFPNDPVTIAVYAGAGVTGALLDQRTVTLPAVLPGTLATPEFIDIDFTGLTLTPGQVYSIAVTTGSSPKVALVYGPNAYAGGVYFDSAGVDATLDVNFRVLAAPGPTCGNADYNGDGDIGTDQDIEAFFACLGGTCCDTCWEGGSDFNGDGDFGTDQDIESFFRVLGGGPC